MTQHIFPFLSELQNNQHNEVAPSSPNFSVSEKLARYGSDSLTSHEHLALFLGNESIAANLLSHFGSIKALSRASLIELRQFLSKRKAESVLGALRMSAYADVEHAFTQPLDNPEAIYRASMDMRILNQEVLRTVLLNTRYRRITTVDISKGTINESVAHPREIFRPAIVHSAYAFVVVHNHPSGDPTPSDADMRLTRRLAEGARLLQIQMLDHVIVGAGAEGRLGYFSFKETGLI